MFLYHVIHDQLYKNVSGPLALPTDLFLKKAEGQVSYLGEIIIIMGNIRTDVVNIRFDIK